MTTPADQAAFAYVGAFVDELATFPTGKHDDQVDAFSQALNRLRAMVTPPRHFHPMPSPTSGDRGQLPHGLGKADMGLFGRHHSVKRNLPLSR